MSENAPPFRRILIANRGEIALRIIWACKELGITTVSVHSEADKDALHVKFADESFCIGPAASEESYLSVPRIISTAEVRDVDAIHPGYGYLGELFASRGFITVSVDENFLNGSWVGGLEKENDARGWMLLQHLKVWRRWNQTRRILSGFL